MSLSPGTRLGPYEVLAPIGAGGMGEVYQARDTKLDRDVAIKVLPESVSRDADVLARFEREAKAVAALSHPNILGIFDFGTHGGTAYAVMELLEGETLRSKVDAGALSQRRAVEYALQIARGLAAAHEKGIVHRDLKPDNIFVTQDGRIKILDFGLAKTAVARRGDGSDTRSPTGLAYTEPGTVMGTVGYMSPEQVKGVPVDHRCDIFSFGTVLYEMLSGRRAFQRETAAETMTAILREDPPELSASSLSVSPALDRIVRHCLEKSPEQRFRSADDIAFSLQFLTEGSGSTVLRAPRLSDRRVPRGLLWGIAGLLAGAIAGSVLTNARRSARISPIRPVRFEVAGPQEQPVVGTVALAPDGSRLAFTAREPGGSALLWIHTIEDSKDRMLRGTEGAQLPFWSPDGGSVGFFANGELKRIAISGGPPQTLAAVTTEVRGASWSGDGRIVFAPTFFGPLVQVSASGGKVTPATTLDKGRNVGTHRWPWFLPDGRHFLYYASQSTGQEPGEIFVGDLGSGNVKHITQSSSLAVYASPGYLLFTRGSALVAQLFDVGRLEARGEATPLGVDLPANSATSGLRALSASMEGTLCWHTQPSATSQPALFDRQGRETGRLAEAATWYYPRLSPDGQRLAIARALGETTVEDTWMIDIARNVATRMTLDPADEAVVIWSSDGTRLVFNSDRKGASGDLYIMRADQPASEELLLASEAAKTPDSWSPDGRSLIFEVSTPQNRQDLWVLPLEGDRKPVPFLATPFSELNARFSPDGRWVAYASDVSGASEIYVRPFREPGGTWRVSSRGGRTPTWRGDGREIYYLAPDGMLIAAPVTGTAPFQTGTPAPLFKVGVPESPDPQYDVFPDGKRFVVNQRISSREEPISVLVNWAAALKKP
jgi:eukaryotic-like serine/threonine-protein kinase